MRTQENTVKRSGTAGDYKQHSGNLPQDYKNNLGLGPH